MKKIHLYFKKLNPEFNPILFEKTQEETVDNYRVDWEDEIKITEAVESYKINHKATYELKAQNGDGEIFSTEIPNMSLFEGTTQSGEFIQLGVSNKAVHSVEVFEDGGITYVVFYIKANKEVFSPFNGMYIIPKDLP